MSHKKMVAPNISKHKNYYRLDVTRNSIHLFEAFDTLEDAIKTRNEFIKKHSTQKELMRNIHKSKNSEKYMVCFTGQEIYFNKTVNTLEEAIKLRDKVKSGEISPQPRVSGRKIVNTVSCKNCGEIVKVNYDSGEPTAFECNCSVEEYRRKLIQKHNKNKNSFQNQEGVT